jgi:hypothetical protein
MISRSPSPSPRTMSFYNFFGKRSTTAPKKAEPVISPPAPSTSTSPPPVEQSTDKLAPTKILKNTILFASETASNAGIPWVKVVSESIVRIIQRIEVSDDLPWPSGTILTAPPSIYIIQTMKLNEEASRDLDNDVKAFLYIVARNGRRNPDDEIVQQFKECALIEPRLILTDGNAFLQTGSIHTRRGAYRKLLSQC